MVDYVCPSDFLYTDFSTRIEDFVVLTENTTCRIYPTVHPVISQGNEATLLPEAGCRGAANNFYAYGAHGISAYNYQYNWAQMYGGYKFVPKEMWPTSLEFVTQLAMIRRSMKEIDVTCFIRSGVVRSLRVGLRTTGS